MNSDFAYETGAEKPSNEAGDPRPRQGRPFEGFHFYEGKEAGLGAYFLANLYSDIESLKLYGGVHRKAYRRYHRALSKRFPFASFLPRRKTAIGTLDWQRVCAFGHDAAL